VQSVKEREKMKRKRKNGNRCLIDDSFSIVFWLEGRLFDPTHARMVGITGRNNEGY
jgi:hypothetical protein